MRIVIDLNLSPKWGGWLAMHGVSARHWSEIGAADATDERVLEIVRARGDCLLTCDLDFGRIVALAGSRGPSVVLLRMPDVTPDVAGPIVLECIREVAAQLGVGALVSIDPAGARATVLPVHRRRSTCHEVT